MKRENAAVDHENDACCDGDNATGDTVIATSVTIAGNAADPTFPAASVAVQVTVVVPSGRNDPDAGLQSVVTAPSVSSVADAAKVTVAPAAVAAWAHASVGTLTTGGVVSPVTVTRNDADPVLPTRSVAAQLTTHVPTRKLP